MKAKWLHSIHISVFFVLLCSSMFAAVNTRLVFVSNTHNSPSPGSGTLVIDVEAISDNGSQQIRAFQDAFQLDAVFRAQNPQVTFSNQRFTDEAPFGQPAYNVTEDYNSSNGVVRYIYTLNFFPPNTIETSWTLIARITIQYTMGGGNGNIEWYSGNPEYFVTNLANTNITGIEEAVPASLNDITLPVELTAFTATAEEDKIVLKWTTQSEVNNLGFEVYRSAEETGNYAMIASFENTPALQGGGNSNTAREYTYEDAIISNGGTYWYQIADVDYQGVRTFHGPVSAQAPDLIPEAYALRPNYPNPFNPETTIRFEVPADPASNGKIALTIYNNLGMAVRSLVSGSVQPGIHTVKWDGRNDRGDQMASGIYFLRLQAGSFVQTQKMLLVR